MRYFILFITVIGLSSCYMQVTEQRDAQSNVSEVAPHDSLCQIEITYDQLRAQKEIEIELPKLCDSIRLYFPAGGTVTSATLYKDSLLKNEFCSTPSFGIMEDSLGFMTISSKTTGKFYLFYGSCHWGSRMWINIK